MSDWPYLGRFHQFPAIVAAHTHIHALPNMWPLSEIEQPPPRRTRFREFSHFYAPDQYPRTQSPRIRCVSVFFRKKKAAKKKSTALGAAGQAAIWNERVSFSVMLIPGCGAQLLAHNVDFDSASIQERVLFAPSTSLVALLFNFGIVYTFFVWIRSL